MTVQQVINQPKGGVTTTLLILGILGLLFSLLMIQTHSFGPIIALVFMILTWMFIFPSGRRWLGTWLFWLVSIGGMGLLCLESRSSGPLIGLASMLMFWMIFFKSGRRWLWSPVFWSIAIIGTGLVCIEANSLGPIIGVLFVILIYVLSTGKNPLDNTLAKPQA